MILQRLPLPAVLAGALLAGLLGTAPAPAQPTLQDEYIIERTPEPARGQALLGVMLGEVSPALSAQLGLDGQGVLVENVIRDTPADRAGLRQYDVITRVDDRRIGSPQELARTVRRRQPGDRIELTVIRQARERTVAVELASVEGFRQPQMKYEMPRQPDGDAQRQAIERLIEELSRQESMAPQHRQIEQLRRLLEQMEQYPGLRGPDGGPMLVEPLPRPRPDERREDERRREDQQRREDERRRKEQEARQHEQRETERRRLEAEQREGEQREREAERRQRDAERSEERQAEARRERPDERPEAQVRRSFEIGQRGQVTVTVVSETGAVVMRFESLDQLRQRRPELYKEFQQLIQQR